jgi:hypothetical protein
MESAGRTMDGEAGRDWARINGDNIIGLPEFDGPAGTPAWTFAKGRWDSVARRCRVLPRAEEVPTTGAFLSVHAGSCSAVVFTVAL